MDEPVGRLPRSWQGHWQAAPGVEEAEGLGGGAKPAAAGLA